MFITVWLSQKQETIIMHFWRVICYRKQTACQHLMRNYYIIGCLLLALYNLEMFITSFNLVQFQTREKCCGVRGFREISRNGRNSLPLPNKRHNSVIHLAISSTIWGNFLLCISSVKFEVRRSPKRVSQYETSSGYWWVFKNISAVYRWSVGAGVFKPDGKLRGRCF